jgi:hypothetical protein
VRPPKSPQRLDWLVYRIAGAKATRLGIVQAADMEAALVAAFLEFGVEPADRRRILVQATVPC